MRETIHEGLCEISKKNRQWKSTSLRKISHNPSRIVSLMQRHRTVKANCPSSLLFLHHPKYKLLNRWIKSVSAYVLLKSSCLRAPKAYDIKNVLLQLFLQFQMGSLIHWWQNSTEHNRKLNVNIRYNAAFTYRWWSAICSFVSPWNLYAKMNLATTMLMLGAEMMGMSLC